MTYLLISIPFLLVAAGIALVAHRRARRPGAPAEARMPWKAMLAAGALLMLLTAIFDTVIIGVGLVDYDESLIPGLADRPGAHRGLRLSARRRHPAPGALGTAGRTTRCFVTC